MRPHEAQARMFDLEHHEQEFSGEEFLAWLLGMDPDDAFEEVLIAESKRAFMLAEGFYSRISHRVAVLQPQMIAQVAFVQGATFAAAALGRQPFPAEADER